MKVSSIPSLARKNKVKNECAICHQTITLLFELPFYRGKSALGILSTTYIG